MNEGGGGQTWGGLKEYCFFCSRGNKVREKEAGLSWEVGERLPKTTEKKAQENRADCH